MSDIGARRAARAIDALRRGWPFRVEGADGSLDLLAVESARDAALAEFSGHDLLLSGERAVTLKLTNQRVAATPGPVRLANAADTVTAALAIADPALDLANPLKGPFHTIATGGEAAATAAMTMARHAGLLPAFFVREAAGEAETACSVDDVAALFDPTRLEIAARARLPVEASESAEIVAFRSPEEASDHVALVVGKRDGNPPVVRLHSECLTGDVLGSLKCDCGPQLQAAIKAIEASGWGVLLYLRQEGRGIGLINKLRAYALQDQGFDTVDANTRLGFAVDARNFAVAGRMLALLGQKTVRLLTNNPDKVAALEASGIAVAERVAHKLPPNPHNARYLDTKRDRTGHQL